MTEHDPEAVRRAFDALVSAGGLDELRTAALGAFLPPGFERRTHNPRLRLPRRDEPVLLRVRVDLRDARPPIWRRLELRSDLTLDEVHELLLAAFSWAGGHLHRFALGGDCFDPRAEWFLCEFDVEEGDDLGTPDHEVRLDETLAEPGDVLHYVYDYGDEWDLVIRLEKVLPLEPATPAARCVGGARAAPPEDSGGVRDAGELAALLDDPAAFDLDEVTAALAHLHDGSDGSAGSAGVAVRPDVAALLDQLRRTRVGGDLLSRLQAVPTSDRPDPTRLAPALAAHTWFLDRAGGEGLPLTAAGYLKPADVEHAAALVPSCATWIGTRNREDLTAPVLHFRQSLQHMGLLRKYAGRLLLTRVGARARHDPVVLWEHLRVRLVAGPADTFAVQGHLLALVYLASEPDGRHEARLAEALTQLGWRLRDGQVVSTDVAWDLLHDVRRVLEDIGPPPVAGDPAARSPVQRLSPAAVALARGALAPWDED